MTNRHESKISALIEDWIKEGMEGVTYSCPITGRTNILLPFYQLEKYGINIVLTDAKYLRQLEKAQDYVNSIKPLGLGIAKYPETFPEKEESE